MKKKFLAMLLALTTVAMMSVSSFCDQILDGSTEVGGTVPVSVTVTSTYSVSLPASLSLTHNTGDNYTGSMNIGVKANLTDSEKVTVVPTDTVAGTPGTQFVMTSAVGAITADASVTQFCTTWKNQTSPFTYTEGSSTSQKADKDNFTYVNCSVSVDLPNAGAYSGNLGFTFAKSAI